MSTTLRGKTISGILFKLFERAGSQIIGILISAVLARLLEPEVVGVVTLAEVFLLFFNVISSYGFGNSLIQKKDSKDIDFSTGFFSSLVLALILFFVIWITAPFIEAYYNYEAYGFATVLRFLGLAVFANAIKSILQAVVAKRLIFKYYFYSSLLAIVTSGLAGILLAYLGFGIWALAVQNVLFEFVFVIVLWLLLKWHPVFAFSIKSLSEILRFGWKLIVFGIINVGYMQLRSLIIAKKYSSDQLAYFNKGFRLAKVIPEELGNSLMAVLFPVFSLEKNDAGVKSKVRRTVKVSFYIVCPMLLGMFSVADNFITLLFSEIWISSAIYLRVFCISYLFYVIQAIESESIKSLGKSGILLAINFISKGIGTLIILCTFQYGVFAISIGFMISLFIEFVMYSITSKKYISYSFIEQSKDIIPTLLMSLAVLAVCYFENRLCLAVSVKFVIQIMSGILVYLGLSFITKYEPFQYLLNLVLRKKHISKEKN